MFRRSRFSVRPNVGTAGRTAAAPQEAPSANQEAGETPKDVGEGSSAAAVTDNKPVVTPLEKPSGSGDGSEQNGDSTSSSAAVQRRKRFAIKPKVAPGRLSSLARKPKSPIKAVSESPAEVRVSDLDKPSTSGQTTTAAGLQSPRRRRPSEESKQLKVQPKPPLTLSDISGPSAVPPAEEPQEQTHLPADNSKQSESASGGQVKDVPSRAADKVPQSLPDKEAIEISEKAKTLVSSKDGLSQSQPAFSLSRLLNDPSDIQRLEKARKLRELLRQEIHKEKKIKRAKARTKEFTLDPAKMTMRDLIRYLPVSNPMTSSLEDPATENETVVPPSPEREESPERAQEPEPPPKIASPRVEEEEEAAEEEQEEALMVPQVKVAEDGSLIIDEESLTVEVQRAKGPNLIQDRDPIFERGSTTTYSSFRKGTYSKPWSSEETDMFFLAVSMVGTDFSMICQLFPHRARSEIKNKFKKEERENAWRIDKAFRERRKLDIEYFSKLLEKILEVQKNRKKLKSLSEKNSPKKHKRKAKGKKAAKKLSDVEEEDEEEESEMPDLEEEEEEKEGEKENEDLCNEGGAAVSKPKKKRKRKNKQDTSTEEPSNKKKNKTGGKSSEQDEASLPEDTEAALPEDQTNSDMSEKTESATAAKDAAIKPAKLSRGRAPKPLLPLGRKWGKKPPPPSTKATDAVSDKGDESGGDGASKEQVEKDASPTREADKKSANDEVSSEEEEAAVKPPRPTRYGRVPKPTKPLTYPAKDDAQSSASETAPASPAEAAASSSSSSAAKSKPKNTAKRGRSSKAQSTQESKKPKLITLRASQSEYSDEENEKQYEEVEEVVEHACSFSKDSTAPAFVPASLRSPHPVIPEVEETMEELDILANMPDVLGISKDALCPDSSFELAQNETITAEPCEHQLDLLVDVIDFLSSEHTEVSEDQSYNEAAQTLLTIGNLAHLSQSAQSDTSQVTIQDHTTVETSDSVDVTSHHLEVEIAPTPAAQEINIMSAASAQEVTETPETVDAVEQQNSSTHNSNLPIIETSDHRVHADMDPTPQSQSSPQRTKTNSPQTKRGRLSKVKPKPNLGQASRSAQSRSQQETKTDTDAPDLSQTTETAAKADSSLKLSNDEISSTEVKLAEEPSDSQEKSVGQVKPGAAELDQSASENQSHFSGTQFEPGLEPKPRESSSDNLMTSDSAVTEPQIGDDSVVQQSSDRPAPCTTKETPEGAPFSLKEMSKDASARQTRKSQIQEDEPKPSQTSRTEPSEPQTTKDTMEKDSNQSANSKLNEKPSMDVEAQPACITSSEKPGQSTCPLSELLPSSDSGSSHMEEVTTTKENETDVGDVSQVESGAATSDQSASENQNTRTTSGTREEELMSTTTERTCSDPLASDSADPESQVGQGSNIDHPASCETPAEDSPASQREDNKTQTRRSQYQRVRPKPNLAQASRSARSEPQIRKDTMEKDSNQTPNPKLHETAVMEVVAQPTCTTSSEKPGRSTDHAPDLLPSVDLGSSLKPTEEPSAAEEKKMDVGLVGPVESENQNTRQTSETTEETLISQVETAESSSVNLLTSDSAVSESQVQQRLNTDPLPIQESSNHPASPVTPAEDSSTSQTAESEVTPACQTRRSRFQRVKPKPNVAQASRSAHSKPQIIKDTKKKDSHAAADPKLSGSAPTPTDQLSTAEEERMDVGVVVVESGGATSDPSASENQDACTTSRPESTDSRKPDVKAVPSCSHTSPGKPHEPTGDLSSTESQDTNVGSALELCSEDSEKNEPQRRRRFSKVKPKPNLRSSTRTTQTKLKSVSKPSDVHHVETSQHVTSQQKPEDNNDAQTQLKPAEKDSEHLSETIVKSTSFNNTFSATSSDTEHLSGLTDSGLGKKNSEKSSAEVESTDKKVETEAASQGDCKQDVSDEATETKPADDPPVISDIKSSEDCSAKSKTPDSKERTQKPHSEKDSEAPSQDSAQKSSETTLTTQTAAQSSDDKGSESSDSSKSSRKAPQTRRGRLVKPKPNLGPRNQPSKSQQVQNVKQAAADSEGVVPSVSSKPESEVQPGTQKPAGGAIDQHRNQTKDPDGAAASLGCLTQVTEPVNPHESSLHVAGSSLGFETNISTLDASASSTGGTQSQPSLTIFPDMLLDQVPSDPDEPFFILSLTEIPVSSSGEMMDGASEHLPYLPVADASVQQESSVSGDGSLSNVTVPASMEEGGETGLIDVNTGSIMENPVDPHEITGVQPSVSPETTGSNEETEHPPSERRPRSSGRTAKLQVKPKPPGRKQASKTLADEEAESVSTQESELPDSSVQPEAFDEVVNEPQTGSGDDVNAEEPEDKSSGAPATRTRRANIQKRKPKDFPSFLSETSSTAQPAHKGPEVETPRTAGRRSTTTSPEASTSHDVAVATGPTQPPTQAEVDLERTADHSRVHSEQTLSTSSSAAEVTAPEHIDIVESSSLEEEEEEEEEEPTNVSQYFLSDIFTDVEEG